MIEVRREIRSGALIRIGVQAHLALREGLQSGEWTENLSGWRTGAFAWRAAAPPWLAVGFRDWQGGYPVPVELGARCGDLPPVSGAEDRRARMLARGIGQGQPVLGWRAQMLWITAPAIEPRDAIGAGSPGMLPLAPGLLPQHSDAIGASGRA